MVNAAATSEGGEAAPARLQTFAFRLKQADQLDSFLQTIDKYKKPGAVRAAADLSSALLSLWCGAQVYKIFSQKFP